MTTSKEEYNSLRQEILNHQNNRLTVLNLALPSTAALIAAGVQFNNPYLLLIPAFLLLAVRVLLVNVLITILITTRLSGSAYAKCPLFGYVASR
jgi:hypothetical protein